VADASWARAIADERLWICSETCESTLVRYLSTLLVLLVGWFGLAGVDGCSPSSSGADSCPYSMQYGSSMMVPNDSMAYSLLQTTCRSCDEDQTSVTVTWPAPPAGASGSVYVDLTDVCAGGLPAAIPGSGDPVPVTAELKVIDIGGVKNLCGSNPVTWYVSFRNASNVPLTGVAADFHCVLM